MTLLPPAEKIIKTVNMCRDKRGQDGCKIKDIAKLVGTLVAVLPRVEQGATTLQGHRVPVEKRSKVYQW